MLWVYVMQFLNKLDTHSVVQIVLYCTVTDKYIMTDVAGHLFRSAEKILTNISSKNGKNGEVEYTRVIRLCDCQPVTSLCCS